MKKPFYFYEPFIYWYSFIFNYLRGLMIIERLRMVPTPPNIRGFRL